MNTKLSQKRLKIVHIALLFALILSFNLYSPRQVLCDSLDRSGVMIQIAEICLKKANIKEDSASEKEFMQLADILKQKYGDTYYTTLKDTVKVANKIYQQRIREQDPDIVCEAAIVESKKIFHKFGLKGYIYERALANVYNKSKFLDDNKEKQTDSTSEKQSIKLTDDLHNQFLSKDNDYALADAMLNATWKMVKKNLDKSAFATVQKEQREWASSKRDARAASYGASMQPSQAYAKVMQERIAELSSLVAKEPRMGDYENERSLFNISTDKGEYQIDGAADNAAGNTCMFEGKLTRVGGWYKVHEEGLPPYYILFTDKGAIISYTGTGTEHGCGANVEFKGEYKFVE